MLCVTLVSRASSAPEIIVPPSCAVSECGWWPLGQRPHPAWTGLGRHPTVPGPKGQQESWGYILNWSLNCCNISKHSLFRAFWKFFVLSKLRIKGQRVSYAAQIGKKKKVSKSFKMKRFWVTNKTSLHNFHKLIFVNKTFQYQMYRILTINNTKIKYIILRHIVGKKVIMILYFYFVILLMSNIFIYHCFLFFNQWSMYNNCSWNLGTQTRREVQLKLNICSSTTTTTTISTRGN